MSLPQLTYRILATTCLFALPAVAQTPTPSFEVASIRPHSSTEPYRPGIAIAGSTVSIPSIWLKRLITTAYGVRDFQVIGGPSWIDGRPREFNFDIAAKTPGDAPATLDQVHVMLRSLLDDRFKLQFHRETRQVPVYVLVVGKDSSKLKADTPSEPTEEHREITGGATTFTGRNGERGISGRRCNLACLASVLTDVADRPVIDETGIAGQFVVGLTYNTGDAGPSLFTAVQEQLGLKLEPQKRPVEVLVIDHAEAPSGN